MRNKLLFLALALIAAMMATSSPSASAAICPPTQHVFYCEGEPHCCSHWPSGSGCVCP